MTSDNFPYERVTILLLPVATVREDVWETGTIKTLFVRNMSDNNRIEKIHLPGEEFALALFNVVSLII